MTPDEWNTLTPDEQAADLRQAIAAIPEEIADETRRSRFRDHCSGRRCHPIQNDIMRLFDFVEARRMRQPNVLNLLRATLNHFDPAAIRELVRIVQEEGQCGWWMHRRCRRLLDYCTTLEAVMTALADYAKSKRGIN